MKIAYSIALYNLINKILFTDAEGKEVERDLPFNVKYKLQKDMDIVSKDYVKFEEKRTELIKEFGAEKDGKMTVTDENLETYKTKLIEYLDTEVDHKFYTLTEEEIDSIKDVKAECHEMELFIMYLSKTDEDI